MALIIKRFVLQTVSWKKVFLSIFKPETRVSSSLQLYRWGILLLTIVLGLTSFVFVYSFVSEQYLVSSLLTKYLAPVNSKHLIKPQKVVRSYTDTLSGSWNYVCVPYSLSIFGKGMGAKTGGEKVQSVLIENEEDVLSVYAQVSGRLNKVKVPSSVVFETASLTNPVVLTSPLLFSDNAYLFATLLSPTRQVTATVVEESSNIWEHTPRGLILYTLQETGGTQWTTVGTVLNEYVYGSDPSDPVSRERVTTTLSFPPLAAPTILSVTAVIIDKEVDLFGPNSKQRIFTLELSPEKGATITKTIVAPSEGSELNIVRTAVPALAGTSFVNVALYSPGDNKGDSVVLAGANVSFPCSGAIIGVFPSSLDIQVNETKRLTIEIDPINAYIPPGTLIVYGRLDSNYLKIHDLDLITSTRIVSPKLLHNSEVLSFTAEIGINSYLTRPVALFALEVYGVDEAKSTIVEIVENRSFVPGPAGNFLQGVQNADVSVKRHLFSTFLPLVNKATSPPTSNTNCIWALKSNNYYTQATNLTQFNQPYCGWLDDEYDYYSFTLPITSYVTVTLKNNDILPNYPADTYIRSLFKPEVRGNRVLLPRIDWCCQTRKRVVQLPATVPSPLTLDPDTYFLQIRSVDIATLTYTITVFTEPVSTNPSFIKTETTHTLVRSKESSPASFSFLLVVCATLLLGLGLIFLKVL